MIKHKRLLITVLAVCLALAFLNTSHIPRVYAAEGIYESYVIEDNSVVIIQGAQWMSQGFTTGAAHNISNIYLKLYRYFYPDTMTVRLQGADANGLPNGTTLYLGGANASEFTDVPPGLWYNFSDSPSVQLLAATTYTIVVDCSGAGGGNKAGCRIAIPGNSTTAGHLGVSTDNGATWTRGPGDVYDGWDALFEIWGDDVIAPVYSNLGHSSTVAGWPCIFSSNWSDNSALDYGIFSTNNTGTWTNNTAVALTSNPSWCNATKTLNATTGYVVQYRWYVNDTSNTWNTTTIQSLTTIGAPLWYIVFAPNSTDAGDPCLFSSYWQDGVGLSGYYFETNNTGVWTNDTWTAMAGTGDWANATHVLNSTIGVAVSYRWYANSTSAVWNTTSTYTFITTDPALTHPLYPPWSIPYYVPLLGKGIALVACFGACALVFASTKNMKEALKGAVIVLLIGIIFLVIWFIMSSLEAYA